MEVARGSPASPTIAAARLQRGRRCRKCGLLRGWGGREGVSARRSGDQESAAGMRPSIPKRRVVRMSPPSFVEGRACYSSPATVVTRPLYSLVQAIYSPDQGMVTEADDIPESLPVTLYMLVLR